MALTIIVPPTELPVTLDEVKSHARETDAAFDVELAGFMRMAVDQLDGVGGLLNRCLLTQTVEYTMDRFPYYGHWEYSRFVSAFDLPFAPLVSVSSITYLDENGVEQTLDASDYRVLNAGVEMKRGRVELAYGESWPDTRPIEQAVTVTYIAGFGDRNALPWKYRLLIMAMVKEMHDHRDVVTPQGGNAFVHSPAFAGLFDQCVFPMLLPGEGVAGSSLTDA